MGRIFKEIWPGSGRRKFVGICSGSLAAGVLLSCWGAALVIADDTDAPVAAKAGRDKPASVLVGGVATKSTAVVSAKTGKETAGGAPAPTKPKNTSKTAATGAAPLAPATTLSPVPDGIIKCPAEASCTGLGCPGDG